MRRGALIVVVLALAAAVAGPPPTDASSRVTRTVSSNWAGYAVTGPADAAVEPSFTSVAATWKVPAARCRARGVAAASAVWVGLGGLESRLGTLEQIGTDSSCTAGGRPTYRAWFEILPDEAKRLGFAVHAGDVIAASVEHTDTGLLVLRLANRTTGASAVRRLAIEPTQAGSAEWIVEAPSQCSRFKCDVVPLADFGAVTFTGATAASDGRTGAIADRSWRATSIELVPGAGGEMLPGGPAPEAGAAHPGPGAVPGPLSAKGRSFVVRWRARAAT
jgi:hypothetical protein